MCCFCVNIILFHFKQRIIIIEPSCSKVSISSRLTSDSYTSYRKTEQKLRIRNETPGKAKRKNTSQLTDEYCRLLLVEEGNGGIFLYCREENSNSFYSLSFCFS